MLCSFDDGKYIFISKVFRVIEELQKFPQIRSREIAKKFHLSKQELIKIYKFISENKVLQNFIKDYSRYGEYSSSVFKIFKDKNKLEKVIKSEITYPSIVEIHLGEKCNLNCVMCFSRDIEYKQSSLLPLKLNEIIDILNELKKCGIKEIWFSGGKEPLMSPYTLDAVQRASRMGFLVRLYTNGELLDNDDKIKKVLGVSQLRISLNAASPEVYNKIHFATQSKDRINQNVFRKVIENIKNIVRIKEEQKSKTKIAISFIVQPYNRHEILKFLELGNKLGVDSVQFRAESVGKIRKFNFREINNINIQIKKIEKNIELGLYKNIDIEFRGLSEEELKTSKYVNQFLPGIKKATLCRAGVYKRGINPYGDVYYCEHSMHPGNLLSTVYKNKKLGNLREEKFSNIIQQSRGKYPRTCTLCQAYGYGLNIILEKLYEDYKWGIKLEDQPYYGK